MRVRVRVRVGVRVFMRPRVWASSHPKACLQLLPPQLSLSARSNRSSALLSFVFEPATLTALRAGLEAVSLNGSGATGGGALSRSFSVDGGKLVTDAMESVVEQIVDLCVESCTNKASATFGDHAAGSAGMGASRRLLPMYLNFLTSMCADTDTSRSSLMSSFHANTTHGQ